MSKEEDWQPGDLALCVRGGRITRSGGVYIVREVLREGAIRQSEIDGLPYYIAGGASLLFEGIPYNGQSGAVERFRKIHPHTPDEEDEETIRLLKGEPVEPKIEAVKWSLVETRSVTPEEFRAIFYQDNDDIGGWIDE